MKILLLGKNGQVGWELQRSLSELGELVSLGRNADQNPGGLCGDLSNLEGIASTIKEVRPDAVVNAAAFTAVDQAESHVDTAFLINAEAPGRIARECNMLGAWLVHFSTDYVFDGKSENPLRENDATNPLSVYGQSKLDGEAAIEAVTDRHVILRTSWVYGVHGQNFIKTIMRLAKERETLSIVDDQWGAPTGAELLADVAAQIIPQFAKSDGKAGLYHCSASGTINWHGYARFIIETALENGLSFKTAPDAIKAIPTSQYKTAATRPSNSRLNCAKIEQAFSLKLPPWQSGVARVIAEISA